MYIFWEKCNFFIRRFPVYVNQVGNRADPLICRASANRNINTEYSSCSHIYLFKLFVQFIEFIFGS